VDEFMQTKAEEYRASAVASFGLSQSTIDPQAKQTLTVLAARWHALADRLEARARSDAAA
jgi:hypothetical protein